MNTDIAFTVILVIVFFCRYFDETKSSICPIFGNRMQI